MRKETLETLDLYCREKLTRKYEVHVKICELAKEILRGRKTAKRVLLLKKLKKLVSKTRSKILPSPEPDVELIDFHAFSYESSIMPWENLLPSVDVPLDSLRKIRMFSSSISADDVNLATNLAKSIPRDEMATKPFEKFQVFGITSKKGCMLVWLPISLLFTDLHSNEFASASAFLFSKVFRSGDRVPAVNVLVHAITWLMRGHRPEPRVEESPRTNHMFDDVILG
jgi:hypothetical protein